MEKQLNNILDFAAELIINENISLDEAIQAALKKDNERCLTCIDDISDMHKGYVNSNNKTQKAFHVIQESVHSKLKA